MDLTDLAVLSTVLWDSVSSGSDVSSFLGRSASFYGMIEKAVKHFGKFQDESFREVYFVLLPHIVRSCDKVEITISLETYMLELLRTHRDSVSNLEIVLKILNETIKATATNGGSMIPVPDKVILELVEILMCKEDGVPGLTDCLKLHIRNFKDGAVNSIWCNLVKCISENMPCKQAGKILIQFFDDLRENIPNFHMYEIFMRIVQELLLDIGDEEQKYGLQLLKFVIEIINLNARPLWEMENKENKLFWNNYFSIMKALIEEQFEAVPPLLQIIMNNDFKGLAFENWMSILLIKMQNVKSVAMKRLAVETILELFKCEHIKENLFAKLINSLNNIHMYNFEEYFIAEQNIEKFLDCDCKELLKSLAYLNWQSVPLHFWLRQLAIHKNKALNVQSFSKELVMKIASRVRLIQNVKVRMETIQQFENLFNYFLTNISVADHVALMENLYKNGNYCSANTISFLLKKFSIAKVEDITTETFSKSLYEIIWINYLKNDDHLELLLKTLTNLPKEKHGSLRFLLVFDRNCYPTLADNKLTKIYEFCRSNYALDLEGMTMLTLADLTHEFCSKLGCRKDEVELVKIKSLNFFADLKIERDSVLADLEMPFEDLLERGNAETVAKLSHILRMSKEKLASKDFEIFLNKLKANSSTLKALDSPNLFLFAISNICSYIEKVYPEEKSQLAERILNLGLNSFAAVEHLSCYTENKSLKSYVNFCASIYFLKLDAINVGFTNLFVNFLKNLRTPTSIANVKNGLCETLKNTSLYGKLTQYERIEENFRHFFFSVATIRTHVFGSVYAGFTNRSILSDDFYKTEILRGEPKQGEERIEEIYTLRIMNEIWTDLMSSRYSYIYSLCKYGNVPGVVACLLKHQKELSASLNTNQGLSLEHRQQLRIAYAVCFLIFEGKSNEKLSCSDDLWEIVLQQKQRPSVTYLYELAIALNSPNMDEIEKQLMKAVHYDEERQLSILSVTFNYCEVRLKDSAWEIDKVIKLLSPFTMSENQKSRMFAKVAIILLLEKSLEMLKPICDHTSLLKTLKLTIGDKFTELSENIRFIISKQRTISKVFAHKCDCVFYITSEPYDEYCRPVEEVIKKLEKSKLLYEKETVSKIH